MNEKRAYTPAEFAALFGREKSWAYRLIKDSRIKVLSDLGRMLVPASEVVRLEVEHAAYLGKDCPSAISLPVAAGTSSGARFTEWIRKRKEKARNRLNGMAEHR